MKTALLTTAAILTGLMATTAQAQEKFTFALNWFPVGDHAAYWVAMEKGYFTEAGLDVTLENSKGSGDSIAKVDTGRADAGLADAAVVIGSRARGTTVQIVGMIFDKSPMNFFSKGDAAIAEPSQLAGKTVAAPPGDSQRQVWPAFARANGLDVNAITWVNIEPTAKVAALAEGRADAVSDYTTGLPLMEAAIGEGKVQMLPWADFGFDLYSMSIMAGADTIEKRPEQLRAFLNAAYRGWHDAMANPEEAMAIFKKNVPEIDEVALAKNMALGFDLMRTQNYKDHGIGYLDATRMCASVDLVNTYMDLPAKVECDAIYNASFLPKVEMPLDVK